jgi:hypothetical protein
MCGDHIGGVSTIVNFFFASGYNYALHHPACKEEKFQRSLQNGCLLRSREVGKYSNSTLKEQFIVFKINYEYRSYIGDRLCTMPPNL